MKGKLFVPHQYQAEDIDFMHDLPYAGLFAEPGLGKTAVSLSVINKLRKKTLVVAPLRICYSVWPGEIAKWSNFSNIKFTLLHGPDKLKNFLDDSYGVYLINPEGIKWLNEACKAHRRFPWKVLIMDESTKFKNPSSKRFKSIKSFLDHFAKRYILTGNPTPNSYHELWSQIYLLDKGKHLGKSYYAYKKRFFYQADFLGYDFQPLAGAIEQITELVSPFCKYRSAEDELDLPELLPVDVTFKLEGKELKQYMEMEKKLFSLFDLYDDEESEFKVLAPSRSSALNKCRQICNGFIYESLDDLEKEQNKVPRAFFIHKYKIELLQEIVEELNGKPLLIAYHFREDLKMLQEAFPKAPYIGSGVTPVESTVLEGEFNAGKHPVMFGHPMSMGHGLNLQETCRHVFWYANTHSFESYDQFIRRVFRQGVTSRVTVFRCFAENTVDQVMIETVSIKDGNQKNFFKMLQQYRKDK
jgi:SNF2 family DNA or RNA helicase